MAVRAARERLGIAIDYDCEEIGVNAADAYS